MSYKSDITATEAFGLLKGDANSILIDVRTIPECSFVGVPNLDGVNDNYIHLPWMIYPTMSVNNNFLDEIKKIASAKDTKIMFLCKVGGRSQQAAAFIAAQGYSNCYNILHGFEGDHNEIGQRGRKNGWKAENLPWYQS